MESVEGRPSWGEQMCKAFNISSHHCFQHCHPISQMKWFSKLQTSSSAGFSGSVVVRCTLRPEVVEGGRDKVSARSQEFLKSDRCEHETKLRKRHKSKSFTREPPPPGFLDSQAK